MTDTEIIEQAKATFVLDTPTERLAREVIAIAEQRALTIACEVEHSQRMENQTSIMAPLISAIIFARSQRRPMGIGQDCHRGAPCVSIELGTEYGRERNCVGFWINSEDVTTADSPSPCERIALALIRLAYSVAEKVKPQK